MIGYVAAMLVFKLGVRLPRVLGLLPARFYTGQAARNLRQDDLDAAMACYRQALKKNPQAPEVPVLREILTMELMYRKKLLNEQIERSKKGHPPGKNDLFAIHWETEDEGEAARKGLDIIEHFLGEMELPN